MRRVAVGFGAVAFAAVAATLALGGSRSPGAYSVDRLVSDGGVPATMHDRDLVNAWGLAAEPGGAWWTANEANDSSTLYSAQGRKQLLTVAVPGGPTGIAYNGGPGFRVTANGTSAPARFVFACEDGSIRAWSPVVPRGWSTRSEVVVDLGAQASVFRGLALAGDRLYATDFHNARVVVLDSHWRQLRLKGAFTDPQVPAWFAPFGISVIADRLFVTYVGRAPVNGNDAPTGGYVDEFDLNGKLVQRVAALGPLNAPWGVALAPADFGPMSNALLVTNNTPHGRINAFDPKTGAFLGALRDASGKAIEIDDVWAIQFGQSGIAGSNGNPNQLFFTAGNNNYGSGTFGVITFGP